MRKITTYLRGISIAFFLLIQCSHSMAAGSCTDCGLSSIGTLSGTTSGCTGQQISFTFNGAGCLYSGCTLEKKIKVFSGSTLIFTSAASTSSTHSFTPSGSGTFTVYGYVKASTYSVWCTTNSISFSVSNPATPSGTCGSVTACENQDFTLSATPASGTTVKWYKGNTLIGSGNSITYSEAVAGTYSYDAYSFNTTTGCQSVNGLSVSATINALATALAISAPSSGELNQSLSVSGSASGTGLTYNWNFGSGATPSTATGTGPFNVSYGTFGSKTITLKVTNCYGCVTAITKTIDICGKAQINNSSISCTGTTAQFSAVSAGTYSTYTWNFGSGATPANATGIGPHSVSYSTTGTKTVTLTVGNTISSSCSDVATKTIIIGQQPSNLVINSNTSVLVNNVLTVSGSSSGSGNTFNWDLGTGATPATLIQGPVLLHNAWTSYTTTYSTGSYSFSNTSGNNRLLILTVGMEHGSAVDLTGVTYGGKSMTQAVEKNITTNAPSYGRVEIWYLKESDLASAGTGSKSFAFTWSGTPDYLFYSAAVFSHVNQSSPVGNSGTNEGCTNPMSISSSLSVGINDMVIGAALCGNEGTYSSDGYIEGIDITNNATTTFTNFYKQISADGSETPSVKFSGTVNRQGIASLVLIGNSNESFNVVYNSVGTKTITLQVTNPAGCTETITKTINVCGKAEISGPGSNCSNTSMQFKAGEMGGGSVYTWNFGTGASPATATGIGPHNISYSTSGSKTVALTVTNSTMSVCNSVATQIVTISESPVALISGPVTGTLNTGYTFTTPSISGASYIWNIPSDGVIVSGTGTSCVVIKWPTTGSKTFSVSVGKNGCTSTDEHTMVIENCPLAFINTVKDICISSPQTFSAVDQGSGVSYSWNFGSGATPATATSAGPHNVMYSTTGSKSAALTVSKTGCNSKTASVNFTVNSGAGTIVITPPSFTIFEDTALTYSATFVSNATYNWAATGGAIITGTGNSVQILFPNSGSQSITVKVSAGICSTTSTLSVDVKLAVCQDIKLDYTKVPLNTNLRNYTYTILGNWVKFRNSAGSDSFNTSRKFQRNKDTAITWQVQCSSTGKSSIIFNRSASDLNFSLRDLDRSSSGQEIITVSGYLNGSLINTSDISATFNSSNVQILSNSGTALSFKGLTTSVNSNPANDIALKFGTKVDSVSLVLSNTNNTDVTGGDSSNISPNGKYKVDLLTAGIENSGQYDWIWKMTNINPSSSNKAISHWDIVFPDCALNNNIIKHLLSAQYSYDGTNWSNLTNLKYDDDPSLTCDSQSVFKFDAGMVSNSVYYRLILSKPYDVDYTANSFWKSGSSEECGQMTFAGIGCPKVSCISDIGIGKMTFCITQPLPVTWLSITALKNNKGTVNVNWATATEINNDYFSVEKSMDNRNFKEIGQQKGAGNTNTIRKYTFEDNSVSRATMYYRIKQTDYNGESAYSAIVAINPSKLLTHVTFNPNPASSNVTLTWDAGIKEDLALQITDLRGAVVMTEPLPKDSNIHYINLEKVKSGLYIINILSKADIVFRSRIVVTR